MSEPPDRHRYLALINKEDPPMEPWQRFWAKTNREKITDLPDDWTHPLWAHLLDVGNAALVLWERYLPAGLKRTLADGIGMNVEEGGRFLSLWIGLHDLGKAIPSFQSLHEPSAKALAGMGLTVPPDVNRLHHGHASIAVMRRLLRAHGQADNGLLEAAAACVGVHHGKLCARNVWRNVSKDTIKPTGALGGPDWQAAQLDLAQRVMDAWYGIADAESRAAPWPAPDRLPPAGMRFKWPDWLMAYAGWTTLADWLGSMQRCYPTDLPHDGDPVAYCARSRRAALNAYRRTGLQHTAGLIARPLTEHFGAGFEPRPLQVVARDLPLDGEPTLVIVEAPTGEGKTEAAFYLSARHGGGIYVAMPTQATADGLHGRLLKFLTGDPEKQTFGAHRGEQAALRLVHGNDLLRDDAAALLAVERDTFEVRDDDGSDEGLTRTLGWFLPKKRALLAAYGVGTVDQVLLGVLHARHFFLRLFALAGKTVVFDEVHSYDVYMNALFTRLLRWLRALGAHVVVLSATLPDETRRQMLRAWGAEPSDVG
ncbi:MAG: CRISPR-associated endonuclease Cas3'', partial [Catalinimonas sp.]